MFRATNTLNRAPTRMAIWAALVGATALLSACDDSTVPADAGPTDAMTSPDGHIDGGDIDGGQQTTDGGPGLARVELRIFGAGNGSMGDGTTLDCDRSATSTCVADVAIGTSLSLTATADAGSRVTEWNITDCGMSSDCSVDVAGDVLVTVTFGLIDRDLSLTLTGEGTVSLNPPADECTATCDRTYANGTTIVLHATPQTGFDFNGWTDDCSASTGNVCTLTLDADRVVGAIFTPSGGGLTTVVAGTGHGTIVSAPIGIDCPGDCFQDFDAGTSVVLTAAANTGSDFVGWSGDCSGTDATCTVSVDGPVTLVAVASYSLRFFDLNVTVGGDGSGTIGADVGTIDCGSLCADSYGYGDVVTLTAVSDTSSTFTGWTGPCTGTDPMCVVTVSDVTAVGASFAIRRFDLDVTTDGSGNGTVTSLPTGIDCGSDCTENVPYGTMVVLSAAENTSDSTFAGWSGACASAGITSTCALTLTSDVMAAATFDLRQYQIDLSLRRVRGGDGSVSSAPTGIDCGTDCSETVAHGTSITLAATTIGAESQFQGWATTDGTCTGTADCTFVATADITIGATFVGQIPVYLNDSDRSSGVFLSESLLSADLFGSPGGVRSDTAVSPGSGVFYFEGHRLTPELGGYGAGVATAAMQLDGSAPGAPAGVDCGCMSIFTPDCDPVGVPPTGCDQAFGAGVAGEVNYGASQNTYRGLAASTTYYGFVVDYRGANPIVHLIINDAAPELFHTQTMGATTSLYIHVGGNTADVNEEIEINPGNDTTNFPFYYDPDAILRAAGMGGTADALVMGWGSTFAGVADDAPVITPSSGDRTVAAGTLIDLTATATDTEDGDLTAQIEWELLGTPHYADRVVTPGGSLSFTPAAIGVHPVQIRVQDSIGQVTTSIVNITVSGTITQYDPVQMTPDAMTGAGIMLSPDALSTRFTVTGKMAIRANQTLYGRFWYLEFTREQGTDSFGAGFVVGSGNLNPYQLTRIPPSMSINVTGSTWRNLIHSTSYTADAVTTFGYAVDYRGEHPLVYIIMDTGSGPELFQTMTLRDVYVELHPMLYGDPFGTPDGQYDMSMNFGASAFTYDPTTVLNAAGVDTTALEVGWGDANLP